MAKAILNSVLHEREHFNTYVLDKSNISIDSNVLFKDDLFEVLSHRCSINNKEVSIFSRSL